MKTFIAIVFFLSLWISFSCDNDDTDRRPLETLEDAKFVALSLDRMKTAVIEELDENKPSFIYPIDMQIDGLFRGRVTIVGADTISGVGGHTGSSLYHYGGATCNLLTYSDIDGVTIENEGKIKYRNSRLNRSSLCYPTDQCPSASYKDTLEISSPSLRLIIDRDNKKIEDIVEIEFLYTRRFESLKEVVLDSSHYNHYIIKTSNGTVFEW